MRVPEEWDRPPLVCGATSYYPALRFPTLAKKEVVADDVAEGAINGTSNVQKHAFGPRVVSSVPCGSDQLSTSASARSAEEVHDTTRHQWRGNSRCTPGGAFATPAASGCSQGSPAAPLTTQNNTFGSACSSSTLVVNRVPENSAARSPLGSSSCGQAGAFGTARAFSAAGAFGPAAPTSRSTHSEDRQCQRNTLVSEDAPELLSRSSFAANGSPLNAGEMRASYASGAFKPMDATLSKVDSVNGGRQIFDGSIASGGQTAAQVLPAWPDISGRRPASPQRSSCLPPSRVDSELVNAAPASTSDSGRGAGDQPSDPPSVEVRGSGSLPGPWSTWQQTNFPPRIQGPLTAAGFPAPTVIQQYAWPILSAGRDLIGVAKTGSGKTLAFLLPPFAKLLETNADPRAPPAILVLAPTRELACQIEQEAKQFGAGAGIKTSCLYGGAPKGPQLAELRQRPQVLVATPGRLNDLLDPPPGMTLAVDVKGVTYLILDEADRMLDMGFEPQIRKIILGLRKDRQTVMFTATWPAGVRRLASEFLQDAAEVRAGEVDVLQVNPDIEQRLVFCSDLHDKELKLEEALRDANDDQAIVFVNTKRMCESITFRIQNSIAIHGDKDQRERDTALSYFKSRSRRVLVATDVAARGLDIKAVKLVVNFEPPNREEDYVHRVGRTGRAGQKGTAVTLLTNEDGNAARSIAEIFKRMELPLPEELERRLASGEMRSGGNRDQSRPRTRGGRQFNDHGAHDNFDFGDVAGSRFSGGFGMDRVKSDFNNSCSNDCPTW